MKKENNTRVKIQIRKGDQVRVMSGRDKGKSGRVLSVHPFANTVVVEHANQIKRHTRPNQAKNIKGGIVEREGPIHASSVLLVCPSCNKHARVGHTTLADGTKARVCRRCGTTLEK
jgi:large subunit ribosomal protein L24